MTPAEKVFPYHLAAALAGAPRARTMWGLDALEAKGVDVEQLTLRTPELMAAAYLEAIFGEPTMFERVADVPGWSDTTARRIAYWLEDGGWISVRRRHEVRPTIALTLRGVRLLDAMRETLALTKGGAS